MKDQPPRQFNLAHYVLEAGQKTPSKVAISIVDGTSKKDVTYRELRKRVAIAASGLRAHNFAPQDRLLIHLGNVIEFPILYIAAIAIGIIPLPVSSQLSASEIQKVKDQIDPAAIISDSDTLAHAITTKALFDAGGDDNIAFDFGAADRLGYMVLTSGSSASPRIVCHAHRAVWARRMMWKDWYDLRADDRMMHLGAFNWSYTLGTGLLDPWAIGATAVIPAAQLSAHQLIDAIQKHRPTLLATSPGIYRRLVRAGIGPCPGLRHGLSAGEKLPLKTRHMWEAQTGTVLHEAFGMSECSTFISGAPNRPATDGAIGMAQSGRRVAIMSDGVETPHGTEGEISVHKSDPGLMLGYYGENPNLDVEWFGTGDIAKQTEDGQFHYLGRSDDMINAGGIRIGPSEIEEAFLAHADIRECAAVEQVLEDDKSILSLHYVSDHPIDAVLLNNFAAQRLATYKIPRLYIHQARLPRSANNKILRRELKEWSN